MDQLLKGKSIAHMLIHVLIKLPKAIIVQSINLSTESMYTNAKFINYY